MTGDAEYFGRRAIEERDAARNAADSRARDAHLEMAERYSDMARAIAHQEVIVGMRNAADAVS
jgi:hypothetical protein